MIPIDFAPTENLIRDIAMVFDGINGDLPKGDELHVQVIYLKSVFLERQNYNILNGERFKRVCNACLDLEWAVTYKEEIFENWVVEVDHIDLGGGKLEEIAVYNNDFELLVSDVRKAGKVAEEILDLLRKNFPELFTSDEYSTPSVLRSVTETLDNAEGAKSEHSPILWKGTPAQLAFILNLLKVKGYLELKGKGETTARQVLEHFKIAEAKTSVGSMGKCFQQLNRDELPINREDAGKFQKIPSRTDLKK